VVQPNFVSERGDSYLATVAREDWPNLYRLKSFRSAGIVLAGGTDTPFGAADPWKAMACAVTRRTASGVEFAGHEALTPEEALALFLADPLDLRRTRKVEAQTTADLCLLTQNWRELRHDLSAARVRTTIMRGEIVYDTSVQSSELERHC
jgi:predicted amidohydrolase YtcJ